MTAPAIVMMVIAMVTVWGGLAAAIINLVRHPEGADDESVTAPVEL
jgi:hypothetical protein